MITNQLAASLLKLIEQNPLYNTIPSNTDFEVQWYLDNRPAGYRNIENCVSGIRRRISGLTRYPAKWMAGYRVI